MPTRKHASKTLPHTGKATHPKPDPKHKRGKDLRRAYEHQGRVELLRQFGRFSPEDVAVLLMQHAQSLLRDEMHAAEAAEALRAAEHASFAQLLNLVEEPSLKLSEALSSGIREELKKLHEKIQEHKPKKHSGQDIQRWQDAFLRYAQTALDNHQYRQGLEWTRAAEALAGLLHAPAAPGKRPEELDAPQKKKLRLSA